VLFEPNRTKLIQNRIRVLKTKPKFKKSIPHSPNQKYVVQVDYVAFVEFLKTVVLDLIWVCLLS